MFLLRASAERKQGEKEETDLSIASMLGEFCGWAAGDAQTEYGGYYPYGDQS